MSIPGTDTKSYNNIRSIQYTIKITTVNNTTISPGPIHQIKKSAKRGEEKSTKEWGGREEKRKSITNGQ